VNILLLDFWSDRNRGDAAMQVGLVRLLRRRIPEARLVVMATYGANQWPSFLDELDETAPIVDGVVGGIRPTFVPFDTAILRRRAVRRLANATGLAAALALLPFWLLLRWVPLFDRALPSRLRASVREIRAADLVLWNGRNFRADSPAREAYEIFNLVYNPIVALLLARPVAAIGVSLWPLRNRLARRLVSAVLGRTFFVSFRELDSYERGVNALRGRPALVELLPDLSFAALDPPNELELGADCEGARPKRLGVTLVDWRGSGGSARDRYVEALSGFLSTFLEETDTEVTIIPQVTYEMEATEAIERELIERVASPRLHAIRGRPTIVELLTLYREQELVVATRMHSAIFALSQGTPVVTIPYDSGGKWGILRMLGLEGIDVPFTEVEAGALSHRVADVWARRDEVRQLVCDRLPILVRDVEANVAIPVDSLLRQGT
jgi:polysaccharide pyruvyl transferase WcaK-like protein